MARELKFEDCAVCANKSKPWKCRGCEAGENFEEKTRKELDFSNGEIFREDDE